MLANDPKKFWRVINPSSDNSVALIDSTGLPVPDDVCPQLLNSAFCNNFVVVSKPEFPHLDCCNYPVMDFIIIEPLGIEKVIKGLKLSSSPGSDLINAKFLKSTVVYSSVLLSRIFQQSLDTHQLPADWKVGKVVPIHKSGSRNSPLNYRPISLTSIPCKVLEHILYSHLAKHLDSNSFFTKAQHGFRKNLSCETQLLSFTHSLHLILDKGSFADCVFFDFAKAFDKVCHQLLLFKLSKLSLDPNLFRWLENFLLNRSQYVASNGHTSSFNSVDSGVPQGSVLGPLLFLIYINDLPNNVSSNIYLFADDCVILREITDNNDNKSVQDDINAISNWCDVWLMQLNVSKCKTMRVTRNNIPPPNYYLNNIPLEVVKFYKYLGVYITSTLSWSLHIDKLISNTNRMLGYIRRNFFSAPSSLKLILYKTLIRSKMDYASSIWDPHSATHIQSLELIQNNAARFIYSNYSRTSSVTSMKNSLLLPPLSARRKCFRLALFHNLYFYNSYLRDNLISSPSYISSRIDHVHKVGIMHCHTRTCHESFIPRTSQEWNHLPGTIVSIKDHSKFRLAISDIITPGLN